MPPGARGATRVADRVVAKIASQAALEVLRTAPEAHRVPTGRGAHATVSVRAATQHEDVRGPLGEARVRLAVELGYPCDIGAECRAVRRSVAQRVRALAGMHVPEVSVTVERLHSAHTARADGERVQ
ncbi:Asp23/Gls24 family envelope stress response protein [Streptomyces sp. NPDC002055]|uniref:Asp23/Gls24 family envelope stress response protein n=1 Tax=Streptomyces sp. NPDC002055 TaxID=3154534 RepID=UPI0033276099